jgi:acetyltransferase EpsM
MYILIGAGGHAKVIIDILLNRNEEIIGFIDDNIKSSFEGFDILGKVSDIPEIMQKRKNAKFLISIGNNSVREKIVNMFSDLSIPYGKAIAPSALVGRNVIIEEGTVVMPGAVINCDTAIGKHSIINTSATIDHECLIGDYVHISPGVNLAGNVRVGNLTHIGIGACSIQNIMIGNEVTVGAGATVINHIEDCLKVVGTPAKPLTN